jgi:hypothetical protein
MVHSLPISVSVVVRRQRLLRAVPAVLLAAALFALLTAAQAQPSAKAARPDPLDPKASVTTLRYESSFARYRLLGEEKPVSWRDANDTVTRIGGWRVYARAAAPASAPTVASATVEQTTKERLGKEVRWARSTPTRTASTKRVASCWPSR